MAPSKISPGLSIPANDHVHDAARKRTLAKRACAGFVVLALLGLFTADLATTSLDISLLSADGTLGREASVRVSVTAKGARVHGIKVDAGECDLRLWERDDDAEHVASVHVAATDGSDIVLESESRRGSSPKSFDLTARVQDIDMPMLRHAVWSVYNGDAASGNAGLQTDCSVKAQLLLFGWLPLPWHTVNSLRTFGKDDEAVAELEKLGGMVKPVVDSFVLSTPELNAFKNWEVFVQNATVSAEAAISSAALFDAARRQESVVLTENLRMRVADLASASFAADAISVLAVPAGNGTSTGQPGWRLSTAAVSVRLAADAAVPGERVSFPLSATLACQHGLAAEDAAGAPHGADPEAPRTCLISEPLREVGSQLSEAGGAVVTVVGSPASLVGAVVGTRELRLVVADGDDRIVVRDGGLPTFRAADGTTVAPVSAPSMTAVARAGTKRDGLGDKGHGDLPGFHRCMLVQVDGGEQASTCALRTNSSVEVMVRATEPFELRALIEAHWTTADDLFRFYMGVNATVDDSQLHVDGAIEQTDDDTGTMGGEAYAIDDEGTTTLHGVMSGDWDTTNGLAVDVHGLGHDESDNGHMDMTLDVNTNTHMMLGNVSLYSSPDSGITVLAQGVWDEATGLSTSGGVVLMELGDNDKINITLAADVNTDTETLSADVRLFDNANSLIMSFTSGGTFTTAVGFEMDTANTIFTKGDDDMDDFEPDNHYGVSYWMRMDPHDHDVLDYLDVGFLMDHVFEWGSADDPMRMNMSHVVRVVNDTASSELGGLNMNMSLNTALGFAGGWAASLWQEESWDFLSIQMDMTSDRTLSPLTLLGNMIGLVLDMIGWDAGTDPVFMDATVAFDTRHADVCKDGYVRATMRLTNATSSGGGGARFRIGVGEHGVMWDPTRREVSVGYDHTKSVCVRPDQLQSAIPAACYYGQGASQISTDWARRKMPVDVSRAAASVAWRLFDGDGNEVASGGATNTTCADAPGILDCDGLLLPDEHDTRQRMRDDDCDEDLGFNFNCEAHDYDAWACGDVYDCNGNQVNQGDRWGLRDTSCSQRWNCSAFRYDSGSCLPVDYDCDGTPVYPEREYTLTDSSCSAGYRPDMNWHDTQAPNLNCSRFGYDGGHCLPVAYDCNNLPVYPQDAYRMTDGNCDLGVDPYYGRNDLYHFNCAAFSYDNGACVPAAHDCAGRPLFESDPWQSNDHECHAGYQPELGSAISQGSDGFTYDFNCSAWDYDNGACYPVDFDCDGKPLYTMDDRHGQYMPTDDRCHAGDSSRGSTTYANFNCSRFNFDNFVCLQSGSFSCDGKPMQHVSQHYLTDNECQWGGDGTAFEGRNNGFSPGDLGLDSWEDFSLNCSFWNYDDGACLPVGYDCHSKPIFAHSGRSALNDDDCQAGEMPQWNIHDTLDLNCAEHGFDGGMCDVVDHDCVGRPITRATMGRAPLFTDSMCQAGYYDHELRLDSYTEFNLNCSAHSFDSGYCLPSTYDCNGRPFYGNSRTYMLNDESCQTLSSAYYWAQDYSYGYELNCSAHNYDNGACLPIFDCDGVMLPNDGDARNRMRDESCDQDPGFNFNCEAHNNDSWACGDVYDCDGNYANEGDRGELRDMSCSQRWNCSAFRYDSGMCLPVFQDCDGNDVLPDQAHKLGNDNCNTDNPSLGLYDSINLNCSALGYDNGDCIEQTEDCNGVPMFSNNMHRLTDFSCDTYAPEFGQHTSDIDLNCSAHNFDNGACLPQGYACDGRPWFAGQEDRANEQRCTCLDPTQYNPDHHPHEHGWSDHCDNTLRYNDAPSLSCDDPADAETLRGYATACCNGGASRCAAGKNISDICQNPSDFAGTESPYWGPPINRNMGCGAQLERVAVRGELDCATNQTVISDLAQHCCHNDGRSKCYVEPSTLCLDTGNFNYHNDPHDWADNCGTHVSNWLGTQSCDTDGTDIFHAAISCCSNGASMCAANMNQSYVCSDPSYYSAPSRVALPEYMVWPASEVTCPAAMEYFNLAGGLDCATNATLMDLIASACCTEFGGDANGKSSCWAPPSSSVKDTAAATAKEAGGAPQRDLRNYMEAPEPLLRVTSIMNMGDVADPHMTMRMNVQNNIDMRVNMLTHDADDEMRMGMMIRGSECSKADEAEITVKWSRTGDAYTKCPQDGYDERCNGDRCCCSNGPDACTNGVHGLDWTEADDCPTPPCYLPAQHIPNHDGGVLGGQELAVVVGGRHFVYNEWAWSHEVEVKRCVPIGTHALREPCIVRDPPFDQLEWTQSKVRWHIEGTSFMGHVGTSCRVLGDLTVAKGFTDDAPSDTEAVEQASANIIMDGNMSWGLSSLATDMLMFGEWQEQRGAAPWGSSVLHGVTTRGNVTSTMQMDDRPGHERMAMDVSLMDVDNNERVFRLPVDVDYADDQLAATIALTIYTDKLMEAAANGTYSTNTGLSWSVDASVAFPELELWTNSTSNIDTDAHNVETNTLLGWRELSPTPEPTTGIAGPGGSSPPGAPGPITCYTFDGTTSNTNTYSGGTCSTPRDGDDAAPNACVSVSLTMSPRNSTAEGFEGTSFNGTTHGNCAWGGFTTCVDWLAYVDTQFFVTSAECYSCTTDRCNSEIAPRPPPPPPPPLIAGDYPFGVRGDPTDDHAYRAVGTAQYDTSSGLNVTVGGVVLEAANNPIDNFHNLTVVMSADINTDDDTAAVKLDCDVSDAPDISAEMAMGWTFTDQQIHMGGSAHLVADDDTQVDMSVWAVGACDNECPVRGEVPLEDCTLWDSAPVCGPSHTPTATATSVPFVPTPIRTATPTATLGPATPPPLSIAATPSLSAAESSLSSAAASPSASAVATASMSATETASASAAETASASAAASQTASVTASESSSASSSPTPTSSLSEGASPSSTQSQSMTASESPTTSPSAAGTPSSSRSAAATPSSSAAVTLSLSAALTPSSSAAVTPSSSAAVTPPSSAAVTPSSSAAVTPSTPPAEEQTQVLVTTSTGLRSISKAQFDNSEPMKTAFRRSAAERAGPAVSQTDIRIDGTAESSKKQTTLTVTYTITILTSSADAAATATTITDGLADKAAFATALNTEMASAGVPNVGTLSADDITVGAPTVSTTVQPSESPAVPSPTADSGSSGGDDGGSDGAIIGIGVGVGGVAAVAAAVCAIAYGKKKKAADADMKKQHAEAQAIYGDQPSVQMMDV